MRKRICLLIFICALLLGALLFTDGSYRPFSKLTPSDIAAVCVQIGGEEAVILRDEDRCRAAAELLRQIDVLFSASPEGEALACVDVTFTDGQSAHFSLYAHCLSIDEKCYSLSSAKVDAMLAQIKTLGR